eukprot:scaffold16695_cov72-Isochrysis_galbana.AAC.2
MAPAHTHHHHYKPRHGTPHATPPHPPPRNKKADPDLQPNADLYAGHASFFAHFQLSLLTNVQLLVTNDWHRVMYATQTAACPPGGTTRALLTQVYFIGVYVAYQVRTGKPEIGKAYPIRCER